MHIRPSRALGASLVAALTALNVWSPALVSAQCVGGAPNSILSRPPEQCDDGNVAAGDGCTAMCTIEPGWTCAPPIDFVTLNTLDYGSSASWTVSPDGLTGTQTVNTADPTVAIFGADAMAATYTFDLRVDTTSDDDFIGFVLGFNSGDITNPAADYLLLDWKQGTQTLGGCSGTAGMALSRVTGVPSPLTQAFWCHNTPAGAGPGVRQIARATGFGALGWIDLRTYRFEITYTASRLIVDVTDTVTTIRTRAFDITPASGSWPTGEIGFYGFSQSNVTYTVVGPRGPTPCNRIPTSADRAVWTTNGAGLRCFDVTTLFSDPDGDAPDPSSVQVVSAPASVTATDPSSGAPPGQICADITPDGGTGDRAIRYRICDDVALPRGCTEATLTVRYNDSPTLVFVRREVLGGMNSTTLASVQMGSSQGAVSTGWDTSSASVATTSTGPFSSSVASARGGTCAIVAGAVVYTEPAAPTVAEDSCILRMCENEPGPLGTNPTGRACSTVVMRFRLDTDGDGIPNRIETDTDSDEDGIPNYRDLDSDDDGVTDAVERGADGTMPRNSDGDMFPDYLDRDSDGDGLTDTYEAGGADADGDGRLDMYVDVDRDGLHDAVDPACGAGCAGTPLPLVDTDLDGAPDLIDVDSDGDGVSDSIESRDVDGDGIADLVGGGVDTNGDGLDDAFASMPGSGIDRDMDGRRDELDDDDDGDGIPSRLENANGMGGLYDDDLDMDGIPDFHDPDDDGDGVLTRFEMPDPNGDRDPTDARDSDMDGTPDYRDADDDGDSIPTRFERPDPNGDGNPSDAENSDGDALADYLDPDDDGDGVLTRFEAPDPNGDGDPADARNTDAATELASGMAALPDYLDPDDDGDTIPTLEESADPDGDGNPMDAVDTDMSGGPNYLDDDDDGDTIPTATERADGAALSPPSDDVDGTEGPNWLDTDADGDGVLDSAEGRGDIDGDGIPNYLDPDSFPLDTDMDGVADHVECAFGTPPADCPDTDMDGTPDWMDPDDDGDGVLTRDELAPGDTDMDGTPDYLDPDDDGDGIPTRDERPGDADVDTDMDGTPDRLDADDDGDGIPTLTERADSAAIGDDDPDMDGRRSWLDTDSDGDGASDMDECPTPAMGCPDADMDGIPGYLDPDEGVLDMDGDGVPDVVECPPGVSPCPDTDMDGTPDFLDPDDDGDGIPTRDERPMGLDRDTDMDGTPDYLDEDDDGDGILTRVEREDGAMFGDDVDGDGVPNYLDTDSDGDGASDRDEGRGDDDGDGVPNYLDPNGAPSAGGFAGGALCSVSAPGSRGFGGGLALVLAALGLALVRRRRSAALGLALAAALLLAPSGADAQALHLDQYRSAELASDGFSVSRAGDLGHLGFGAMLQLDYGLNPLVWEDSRGDAGSESRHVVEHQLAARAGVALGLFERLVIYASLPVNLVMVGDDTGDLGVPAADGTTLGDASVGARVRLFGEDDDVFAMALQAALTLPSAQWAHPDQRYSGEDGVTVHPEVVLELRPGAGVWIAGNLGARIRATDRARYLNLGVSHEFTWGLALGVPIVEEILSAHVEVYGATSFENFGDRATSPVEAIAGLRVQPIQGLHIGLAGGPGLARGYGSPDLRGVLTIGWATPAEAAVVEEIPEPAIGDRDHDGIPDDRDECADEPEDTDAWQDEDGCPDIDNDADGVLDVDDGAPNDPEDPDGWQDTDGVPDPDNDADGVLDAADACPTDPEDVDGWQDEDGCPDPDNDGDTVPDAVDQCPLDPGTPEANGCPRSVRVDRETGTIFILQLVEFATNRDVILERSFPVLEEVRAVLDANPQLTVIRVEGHTDARGRDDRNMDLSRRRARSVMRWLIAHGIAASRLEAWGCGELHPTETNDTADGRQANRRVEFHILTPVPPSGARALEGCQQITE